MTRRPLLLLTLLTCLGSAQAEDTPSADAVRKILQQNPDILTEVIKANPMLFMDALQEAAQAARIEAERRRGEGERAELERALDKPLAVNVRDDDAVLGPIDAPITLVEFSDFECPYCKRGFEVVQQLQKRYPGKIRLVYRHLPLDFHKHAAGAARQFELVRLQDVNKAFAFHDIVFRQQSRLQEGEPFLREAAQRAGADLKRLDADAANAEIQNRIAARLKLHERDAAGYGISGTPGFLLNGVPVRGAYPLDYFVSIINRLVEKKRLAL